MNVTPFSKAAVVEWHLETPPGGLRNSPSFCFVLKLGDAMPSKEHSMGIAKQALTCFTKTHPERRQIFEHLHTGQTTVVLGTYLGNYLDKGDVVLNGVRSACPAGRTFKVILSKASGETYCVVFLVADTSTEHVETTCLNEDYLDASVQRRARSRESGTLTEQLDIRQVLGSFGIYRIGLVIAGSPGWDKSSTAAPTDTRTRNQSDLVATWNDCNVILQQLLALSPDGRLYGTTCLGTVQSRSGFWGLLRYVVLDKRQRQHDMSNLKERARRTGTSVFDLMSGDEFLSLGKRGKLSGILGTDMLLSDGIISDVGLSEIAPGGAIAGLEGPTTPLWDRMLPIEGERFLSHKNIEDVDRYAVIYYSGHGSSAGDMQIEKSESIGPEELAEFSKAHCIILVVILDMCSGFQFARRFGVRLGAIDWKGVVFSANDRDTNGGLAFESRAMTRVRRYDWPVEINRPDWKLGRGIYTTAFAHGLLLIKEAELRTGIPHTVSLRYFNDEILRSACRMYARDHGVPLVRPTLHCFL
jgi:hypothetical protein